MLTIADFAPFGVEADPKLGPLITDVVASARVVAPCIDDPGFTYTDAAVAILRQAVLRRLESGAGGVTTHQRGAGPFTETVTVDSRRSTAILRPADIADLQALCAAFSGRRSLRAGAVLLADNLYGLPVPLVHPFMVS